MKNLLLIIITITIISCSPKGINSDECKSYYQFIKNNWVEVEPYVYKFKGNPEYWNANKYGDKYLNERCLIGADKEFIIKLFGKPSKTTMNPYAGDFIYCMNADCIHTTTSSLNEIWFTFKEDTIIGVYSNPPHSFSISD